MQWSSCGQETQDEGTPQDQHFRPAFAYSHRLRSSLTPNEQLQFQLPRDSASVLRKYLPSPCHGLHLIYGKALPNLSPSQLSHQRTVPPALELRLVVRRKLATLARLRRLQRNSTQRWQIIGRVVPMEPTELLQAKLQHLLMVMLWRRSCDCLHALLDAFEPSPRDHTFLAGQFSFQPSKTVPSFCYCYSIIASGFQMEWT